MEIKETKYKNAINLLLLSFMAIVIAFSLLFIRYIMFLRNTNSKLLYLLFCVMIVFLSYGIITGYLSRKLYYGSIVGLVLILSNILTDLIISSYDNFYYKVLTLLIFFTGFFITYYLKKLNPTK